MADRKDLRREPDEAAAPRGAEAPVPPPRPTPEPAEVPELLGERSDYPIPRGGD